MGNPCTARESHVMLQMKRTLEAVSAADLDVLAPSTTDDVPPPCKARLGLILRTSLEAGKAVRNSSYLPEILGLQQYGDGGRFSLRAPKNTSKAAARAALEKVIKPAVASCVAKLGALENADVVVSFRCKAEQAVAMIAQRYGKTDMSSAEVRKTTNRLLHIPTLVLKAGG